MEKPFLSELPRHPANEVEDIRRFNEMQALGRADAIALGITSPLDIQAHALAWVKRNEIARGLIEGNKQK